MVRFLFLSTFDQHPFITKGQKRKYRFASSHTLRIGGGFYLERVQRAAHEPVHVPPGRGLTIRAGEHRLELDLDEVIFDELECLN